MINPAILLNETRWWEGVSFECVEKLRNWKFKGL